MKYFAEWTFAVNSYYAIGTAIVAETHPDLPLWQVLGVIPVYTVGAIFCLCALAVLS